MAFRIKGANGILKELVAWVSSNTEKITDFNVGSATRTLLESVALEVEEFYYDLEMAVKHAIKNAGYEAFSFKKEEATRATGHVTIYFDEILRDPLVIPKGTRFHTGDRRLKRTYYRTVENVKIEAGAQAGILRIEAEELGERGNAVAGEICKLDIGRANVYGVANTTDIVNGKNEENEVQRELRFKEYVHTLQKGTAEAVAYGIKQVPGVSGVYVDDSYIGYMKAYVHDKDGNLSEQLKAEVLRQVEYYRSGGIEVVVSPIIKKEVDIEIQVFYREGLSEQIYDSMVTASIHDYIMNLKASEPLKVSNLVAYLYNQYGESISYISLDDVEDVDVLPTELLVPGDITVNGED